ncbi:MAG: hypothetical protein AAF242_13555, partial [Bacteroidota bacterium]
MYRRLLLFFFGFTLLGACTNTSADQSANPATESSVEVSATENTTTVSTTADRAALESKIENTLKTDQPAKKDLKELSEWLSDEEISTLIEFKQVFDRGLMLNQGSAEIARVYQFHAHGTRMEMMDQTSLAHYFPYNEEFDQNEFRNFASQFAFLNKNCGFQIKTNKEEILTFNHYCFNKDNQLFEFYRADGNSFINGLLDQYQEAKAITPAMKQS